MSSKKEIKKEQKRLARVERSLKRYRECEKKTNEFDELLQTINDAFDGDESIKNTQLWMKLYEDSFNFYISIDDDLQNLVVEACIEKLLAFCKGRSELQRRTIYRLFSFWWRVPLHLGRYKDVPENFLDITK